MVKVGIYDKMCTAVVRLLPDRQHYIWLRSHWRARNNIVLAPKRKPYWIGPLFSYENGDFSAISVKERSCTAPISKVERHTDWIGPLPNFGAV